MSAIPKVSRPRKSATAPYGKVSETTKRATDAADVLTPKGEKRYGAISISIDHKTKESHTVVRGRADLLIIALEKNLIRMYEQGKTGPSAEFMLASLALAGG